MYLAYHTGPWLPLLQSQRRHTPKADASPIPALAGNFLELVATFLSSGLSGVIIDSVHTPEVSSRDLGINGPLSFGDHTVLLLTPIIQEVAIRSH